jgi:hypothetical protein
MANISSYDQLSSWNEDDDLLFVQQPDAPKKAHPSQVKQYVEAGDFEATGEVIDGYGNILKDIADQIATKVEGFVFPKEDHTSLTEKMDNIKVQRKNGAFIMYCSSVNPDFPTIGYCIAIGLTIFDTVSAIVAVNTQTGEIWTNGNTSQRAGDWRGWRKIN